jgi:hypothetical protein
VSSGAVVFAGARVGARVIVGDGACVRERCEIGDDVVIGRGAFVENDTSIGALTKVQAMAYITAHSTIEDSVFIAPCVQTTNDNFMGRTERRHELRKGPTILRVSAGALFCARGSRSGRRPLSAQVRSSSTTCRREWSLSAILRASSGRFLSRSSSTPPRPSGARSSVRTVQSPRP